FRHGFTGKEYDSWTGLYNYGFRDYASRLGRFTTVDPIQDGLGWYAYVNSDPVSWLDPWGLCPTDTESGEDPARNAEATEKAPSYWRDNGDGTWTVTSEGATLWDVWGADSYAVTGLTEEQARRIYVGDTFGKKIESTPVITDDIQRLLPVAETGLTLKPIETKVSLEAGTLLPVHARHRKPCEGSRLFRLERKLCHLHLPERPVREKSSGLHLRAEVQGVGGGGAWRCDPPRHVQRGGLRECGRP
ncbi:MAG: RHS repeat-associated core domain-containing protein, partial [Treponema sp.]|nr:RHS repeat-associated core domain-containing protein [Treponema sp.]